MGEQAGPDGTPPKGLDMHQSSPSAYSYTYPHPLITKCIHGFCIQHNAHLRVACAPDSAPGPGHVALCGRWSLTGGVAAGRGRKAGEGGELVLNAALSLHRLQPR